MKFTNMIWQTRRFSFKQCLCRAGLVFAAVSLFIFTLLPASGVDKDDLVHVAGYITSDSYVGQKVSQALREKHIDALVTTSVGAHVFVRRREAVAA